MNTNMDMSDAHGGAVEEEEAHWVGTVRTSLAIAGNVDAGESQVLFRPCKGQANSKGGWNNNQSPQPAKKEDKCANDADANADANVDANANDDDDDKADNNDGHQDALEMLTSILQNQGALQNQNQLLQ